MISCTQNKKWYNTERKMRLYDISIKRRTDTNDKNVYSMHCGGAGVGSRGRLRGNVRSDCALAHAHCISWLPLVRGRGHRTDGRRAGRRHCGENLQKTRLCGFEKRQIHAGGCSGHGHHRQLSLPVYAGHRDGVVFCGHDPLHGGEIRTAAGRQRQPAQLPAGRAEG